jgi:hypothetical protein
MRAIRFGLVVLAAVLMLAGAYSAYWFIAARRIEDGIRAWAQSARAEKIDASWQTVRVTGFPTAFRVELAGTVLRDRALTPAPEFRFPLLSGTARPWDFAVWRLVARDGFAAGLAGAGERAPARLAAQTADGVVSIDRAGGWTLWLRLHDAEAEAVSRVRVGIADGWIIVPPRPPHSEFEPKMAVAANARQLELPAAVGPLGDRIEELAFGATLKGPVPSGRLPEALAAWRDAGGTIELDNLRLEWGVLGATATGTLALDRELQPVGGFSGAIEGYDQILTSLVDSGRMRAGDAGLARIALTMLAKAGPDGRPQIRTAFKVQNGQMFLGPAKLGKAPRFTWE